MTENSIRVPLIAVLVGFVLLILSSGCDTGDPGEMMTSRESEGVATAEQEPDLASEYDELADHYEQMAVEMPTAGRRGMGHSMMIQMAGQMRHFARRMGNGGPMGGEMMEMGNGRGMRRMHRGAMGAGGPAGMADWHLRMAELHRQWADEQTAGDDRTFAEHHEQMAARHRSLAETLGSAVSGTESGIDEGDGAALYAASCASCHGPQGEGVAGAFPPLVGSPWVVGPVDRTARIVLRGLQGPLEIAGETYHGVMPAFAGRLDDAQIAALLTFVRTSWGNRASPVAPEDVAEVRAATEGSRGFTVEELEASGP